MFGCNGILHNNKYNSFVIEIKGDLMTEKRFTLTHINEQHFSANIYDDKTFIASIGIGAELIVELLNSLNDENVKLRARNKYLATKIQRERNIHVTEHEKWEEEIQKENEQLKSKNRGLQSELQIFKEDVTHSNQIINKLNDENEQLKTTISRLIEQNRKNNDLLVSDIRLLEKALWCPNCTRNIKRLKELKKEFEND